MTPHAWNDSFFNVGHITDFYSRLETPKRLMLSTGDHATPEAFGALGLLLASRTRTIEGASGLMNLVMLPMWIFSGVFFSASRFPDEIQPLIQVLPLTAVIDALRANVLRGEGLATVAPELAVILAWLVLSFSLALRLFRWR
jgi:ABC-type multidrug transport system permease subunit